MITLRSNSVLILACLALSACSVYQDKMPAGSSRSSDQSTQVNSAVVNKLYSQYREWQGTRYKMGGLSKGGVDCSGFVYLTFRNQFGVNLPRSTDAQAQAGEQISLKQLQPGDLVFFKTSWKVRHVGIYLENNAFLHASTTNGVMISQLDDYYWQGKVWQARRFYF